LGVDIQSKLKKLSLDTPILDIHRSPTHRTLQTFTHSTLHILGADFNIHTADPRLREIDMGSMIGKNPTEPMQIGDISTTYGRFFMSILASRDVPFPGGESREQV
jgi:broad specificity phosphatase PhoE